MTARKYFFICRVILFFRYPVSFAIKVPLPSTGVSSVGILGFQRWGILRQTRNIYEIPTRLLSLKVGVSF